MTGGSASSEAKSRRGESAKVARGCALAHARGVNDCDVAVIGAGPAGSECAAMCAAGGLRTVIIEKSVFPREKVCGDCLNPACWPLLDRLGVSDRVRALPHSALAVVEFFGLNGRPLRYPLADGPRGKIAVKRSALDQVLLDRARELGAVAHCGAPLTRLERGWKLRAAGTILLHADSLVFRLAERLALFEFAEEMRAEQGVEGGAAFGRGRERRMPGAADVADGFGPEQADRRQERGGLFRRDREAVGPQQGREADERTRRTRKDTHAATSVRIASRRPDT